MKLRRMSSFDSMNDSPLFNCFLRCSVPFDGAFSSLLDLPMDALFESLVCFGIADEMVFLELYENLTSSFALTIEMLGLASVFCSSDVKSND